MGWGTTSVLGWPDSWWDKPNTHRIHAASLAFICLVYRCWKVLSCIQMLVYRCWTYFFFSFFFFINKGYWTCHLWPASDKFKQQACGKLERGTAISWSLSNALRRIKFKKKSYLLQKLSLHTSFVASDLLQTQTPTTELTFRSANLSETFFITIPFQQAVTLARALGLREHGGGGPTLLGSPQICKGRPQSWSTPPISQEGGLAAQSWKGSDWDHHGSKQQLRDCWCMERTRGSLVSQVTHTWLRFTLHPTSVAGPW